MDIIENRRRDGEVQLSQEEPVSYHRRGHWFESSTAHHRTGLHNEELPLGDLIEAPFGVEGKRRRMFRQTTNDELFKLYDGDLLLRLHNVKNLSDTRKTLERFKEYLGS
jgi:hypothetical protein